MAKPQLQSYKPMAPEPTTPTFDFARDTFRFPNELVWEYRFDPGASASRTFRREPPPAYAHHCFVLVRSARQFFFHARFDPGQPPADPATCRRLIRQVVDRSPRQPSAPAERIVIPGFAGLRDFSAAHEAALKAECGGAWQSYCLRSHWRMVFPVSRRHQAGMAQQVLGAVRSGRLSVLHLFRFPQLTINHGILLYGVEASAPGTIVFAAYDPNLPERPSRLTYQEADRTFRFPRNHYWLGGAVDVVETYRNWFY